MIFLEKGVQVGEAIHLRAPGQMKVLSAQFAVDQKFAPHDGLAPRDNLVQRGSGNACEFGNPSNDHHATWQIFGKVTILEIRQILFALRCVDLSHGMDQTAVSRAGLQHCVNVGLVPKFIGIVPEQDIPDVKHAGQIETRVPLQQDVSDLHDLIRNLGKHFSRAFVDALIEDRSLIKWLGQVLVAVESVRNSRVDSVGIHQGDGQKVGRRLDDGFGTDELLENRQDVLERLSLGRRNDCPDLSFGAEHLD
mmetsp:Transcript_46889/g.87056  ORF Transcript_46889/g.87056 Transcript_46889/m.87056 type:complete len:250 (-) Transcript_46889:396-1145(-)